MSTDRETPADVSVAETVADEYDVWYLPWIYLVVGLTAAGVGLLELVFGSPGGLGMDAILVIVGVFVTYASVVMIDEQRCEQSEVDHVD